MAANSAASLMVKLQKLSNQATEKSFKYNTQEANTARTWQKMMSDTSHQREVKDLKAAGLNPVLSAGGQGAQSYTTSSASGQAENPSSAIANVYGADVSAQATRAAAAQSAAAQRYAAQQAAAAQRYAAMMSYESTKYAWDAKSKQIDQDWNRKNDYMKEEYKQKVQLVNAESPKNLSELIWRWSERSGLNDKVLSSKATKGLVNFAGTLVNNPSKFFQNNVKVAKANPLKYLNQNGYRAVNTQLKQLGIKPTNSTRKSLLQFIIFGDRAAMMNIGNHLPKKVTSARKSTYDNHINIKSGRMTI